jgi:hypothetical protein
MEQCGVIRNVVGAGVVSQRNHHFVMAMEVVSPLMPLTVVSVGVVTTPQPLFCSACYG